MSIKWLTRGKYGIIGLLLSMAALPSWAVLIQIPSHLDNSACLFNPTNTCVMKLTSGEISETFDLRGGGFQVTDGMVYAYFDNNEYATSLGRQQYIPGTGFMTMWAPFEQGEGYLFRVGNIGGSSPDGDEVPFYGELLVQRGDQDKLYKTCTGTLEFSNSWFRNHMDKNTGLKCPIPKGYFPVTLTLKAGIGNNIPIHIMMRDPKTRTKVLKLPVPWIVVTAEGASTGNNGKSKQPENMVKRKLFNGSFITLNDRLCKISTPNPAIDFGNISTTAPAGKIAEQKMPLTVTCAGVRQPINCGQYEKPACRPSDAWLGVDNNLVGVTIKDQHPLSGLGADKKIGLKTNDKVRNDLFVEGSWHSGAGCGVNSLFTNGTRNTIDQKNVPASHTDKEMPSVSLPSLYWRLCAQPKNGHIQPGQFQGQALISIEYE